MPELNVAQTILEQLGGRRFLAMTGAANLIAYPDKLSMKLGRNNAGNHMEIILTPDDLYTIQVERVRIGKGGITRRLVAKEEGIYNDQLQAAFTRITGLHTHL